MEFSQKFIDELLKIFEVTGKVTTTGLKLQVLPEDHKVQCDRVIHQNLRSAVGKLLWMAQLRDDFKHPVKELSRSLINPQDLRYDSSSSRVTRNQEFYSRVQFSHFVIFSQHCHSDRCLSRKVNGFKIGDSRRSKHIELKFLWVQDEAKEGKLELKKVGTHFNPSDVLTRYVPASVLGQHLPRLNIFKVNSQRSKSVHSSAKPVQYSAHPQLLSISSITTTPLSIFMFSSINFDHQGDLRQRLSQVSRRFKRMLTPPRRGSGDQGDSSIHRRCNVIQHGSDGQENQGAGVGVIESIQRVSESADHSQQPPPPPQNHESRGSTSQWKSWIRSCFSVSVSLSSLSWRRRQDQGRNQENQDAITQRQSHLHLQISRVMSYVLLYSFFRGFVIFLFNSLHPSDQSSVQKSSAEPFVTEAVFDSTSESGLSASIASLASLKPIASAVTSDIRRCLPGPRHVAAAAPAVAAAATQLIHTRSSHTTSPILEVPIPT